MTVILPDSGLLITDETGRILEASEDGARMLNLTPRAVHGRELLHFIVQDRPGALRQLDVAARGHVVTFVTSIQPRERAPRQAVVHIMRLAEGGGVTALEWRVEFRPKTSVRPTADAPVAPPLA